MAKFIKSRISEVSESRKKLKDIPRGETFEYCGREWIVLEHQNVGSTLVLLKNPIGRMPFDKYNCNNWAKSSLRQYLNSVFLGEMCGENSRSKLGFCVWKTDLTSDDGLKDYGSSLDIISLLTCDLYRKHRDILEPIEEWWWLATPYSTLAAFSCSVRVVSADGTLGNDSAYGGYWGVRPLCYLSSDILVETSKGTSNA